jgi:hypothetical protein
MRLRLVGANGADQRWTFAPNIRAVFRSPGGVGKDRVADQTMPCCIANTNIEMNVDGLSRDAGQKP